MSDPRHDKMTIARVHSRSIDGNFLYRVGKWALSFSNAEIGILGDMPHVADTTPIYLYIRTASPLPSIARINQFFQLFLLVSSASKNTNNRHRGLAYQNISILFEKESLTL